ncbi:hypothetical protein Y032_0004g1939 [Ancylostoma ceylanicum]|uniref:Uncharacterized protein n=1 Tax=Ancylostoma ceylanicum TaxID=53326 RepID=A0A016VWH2_9BILA|nr:hypothetical protein Y032_0004g1939 [Ancylostoma ceylanicum]
MKLHFELHHYLAQALNLQPIKTSMLKEKCSLRILLLLCFLLKRENMLEFAKAPLPRGIEPGSCLWETDYH